MLDEISVLPCRSIIGGDFHCPSVTVSDMLDQRLIDIIIMNDCRQHVSDEPTRQCGGLLYFVDYIETVISHHITPYHHRSRCI